MERRFKDIVTVQEGAEPLGGGRHRASPSHRRRAARAASFMTAYLLLSRAASATPPNNVQRSPVQSTLSPRSAVLVFRHTLGFAVAEARMQTNANGHREAAQPGSTHVAQDDPHVAPARRPPPRRPRFFKGRPAAQTPLVPLWHGARGRRGLHGVGTESAARTCCFECVGPARAAPASSQKRFEGVALKLHQDSRRRRRARRTVAPADGVITCKK